jgi:DNA-binding NtrC family response regulator
MAVILVVEDEEQVRVLAESFLQAEGNKTLSAATIEQAIALIEGEEPVDLLFVDLKIQDDLEGGLKLAKKAVEARPKLKVLYASGQAVTDGMTALFVKQSAFLPKPYTVTRHSSPNSGSAVAQSKVWASHVAERITNRNLLALSGHP